MLRFVAVAAVLSMLAGCIWVMGDTSGYGLPPPPPCKRSADCEAGVCCATLQGLTVVGTCNATCGTVEICEEDAGPCSNGRSCAAQTCYDAGISATICGACPPVSSFSSP